jgi:hypothetical protein
LPTFQPSVATTPNINQEELSKVAQALAAQHQRIAQYIGLQQFNLLGNNACAAVDGRLAANALAQANALARMYMAQQQSHHQQHPSYCFMCSKQFPNPTAFAIHLNVAHLRNANMDMENIPLSLMTKTASQRHEEQLMNLHSDTATTSSCASTPQKVSPVTAASYSPQCYADFDRVPSTESVGKAETEPSRPMSSQTEIKSEKLCEQCDHQRQQNVEMKQELLQTRDQLERLKDMLNAVAHSFSNANAFKLENLWMLQTK